MGTLMYGSEIEVDLDDRTLLHLDALLTDIGGNSFQLHIIVQGRHERDLISVSVTPGVHLVMQYPNTPELLIDQLVIKGASEDVLERGLLTIPFRFPDAGA